MAWVSKTEFQALKKKAAIRKSKRAEKAAVLWPAPKRKYKKKSVRKSLIAKCDMMFSLYIRMRGKKRTGGLCEICMKRPIEVCFHWVSRGDYATRWLPENSAASCRGDNYEETFRKQKYRDMFITRFGLEERERLEALARTKTHFSESDLEAIHERFKFLVENNLPEFREEQWNKI